MDVARRRQDRDARPNSRRMEFGLFVAAERHLSQRLVGVVIFRKVKTEHTYGKNMLDVFTRLVEIGSFPHLHVDLEQS